MREFALLSDTFRHLEREMSDPRQCVTDRSVSYLLHSTVRSISVISDGRQNSESGTEHFLLHEISFSCARMNFVVRIEGLGIQNDGE